MKKDLQTNYNMGRDLGYDMLDALSKKTKDGPTPIHFIGALTSIFECITFFDKDEQHVNDMISTALNQARENYEEKAS